MQECAMTFHEAFLYCFLPYRCLISSLDFRDVIKERHDVVTIDVLMVLTKTVDHSIFPRLFDTYF